MKIRIDIDQTVDEPEIVIRATELSEELAQVQKALVDALKVGSTLTLSRDGKNYYLPPDQILFFEAVDGKTYAHTPKNIYEAKLRLYELEASLPSQFARVGKSVIVNTKHILSIARNLTGPSLVQFRGSHKQINVSRDYYKTLEAKLNERRIK